MAKDESTKRYTNNELTAMRRRGKDRTDWQKVDSTTNEELEKLIAADEEERDLVPDWANAFVVLPEPKGHINLRVDQDVLRFFRTQGPGYQTRMNAVLRSYMLAFKEKRQP
jgi:uncharacterized protein (DUF4415 family)